MENKGLIHVIFGNGNGKSSAAIGLAVRAAGQGLQVVILQFLKSRSCGEIRTLSKIPNIRILRNRTHGFFKNLSASEQEEMRRECLENLQEVRDLLKADACDLLILDEVLDALRHNILTEHDMRQILSERPVSTEIVMTGHKPIPWVLDEADYISEVVKLRHPFDDGVPARRGIEY